MLRFLNSPVTVIALRVAACGLATFVGAFLMANHRYPCSRREIFRYQLCTEDTLLTAMALTVAMLTPMWVCLHAWGKVKWVASLNYLFEIVSIVLILVPMIYWGTSATATTACGTLKDQTGSLCLSNVCDVIQVSMTTSSVLLVVLLISFFIALFQTRKASTPTMLDKCVVNETMMEVCTPRDTFHTELVTPTTVSEATEPLA
ncbi:hypothetical protein AeMF1_001706 [Aphanomyces euteiches]|nr:hypothetical protein AeMF1_001706 [Aphanomyces euteiches]